MRLTTRSLLFAATAAMAAAAAAGCVGAVGDGRKPGRGTTTTSTPTTDDAPCTKVNGDVTIRAAADMTTLPKTGCYDIYGKLSVQGQAITSLAGLNGINSVDELDLENTGLTAIDTKRPLGIYGKLSVTGNPELTNLAQLSFETASTGVEISSNPVLASLDPLTLTDPVLTEVDGDVAITDNAALTAIPLGKLARVAGALSVSGNAAATSLDLGALSAAGGIEISDNARLAGLGTMGALYRVTGSVTVDGNAALVNLAAFTTSLKFIDQTLSITNNAALTDLGSLKHVQLIGEISITGNQSLVSCRASEVDRCTQHPTASLISNNKNASCSTSCT